MRNSPRRSCTVRNFSLRREGLPANEQRTQFILPVVRNLNGRKLKMVNRVLQGPRERIGW